MENRGIFLSMMYGLITVLVIILSISFITSLLLRFTNLTETTFNWVLLIFTFIALLIGGFVSGGKSKQKGWIVGAGTGLLYSLVVFLIQYLGYNTTFTAQQYLFHLGFIITAIVGGIIGVNVVRNSKMV